MEASNEERESIIYQKKYQIKTIKTEISQKSELLEKLNQRNKRVSQLSAFMAMTPSIVLYIEDLQSKITNLQIKKTNNTQELATLDQQVAELRNSEATLDQRISLKNSELNNLQTSFAKLETEISNIKKSIENTKHEIDVKTQKYNETKDQIEDIIKTRKTQLTKFDDLIKEQKLQLEEYTHSKSKAESEQTQMQELVKQEKMRNLDVVQELRKRLNSLIETGDDSDIPKIDRDLRLQISKISEENKMMKDKTVMLRQAINLINEELKSKQNELRKITLLSQPNPKLLANTNFQILETLLEETILQNKQLLVRQSEISNEIDKLRAEKLNNN
ncbi:hypothetical protein GPJ56_006391 [Histomonas meleagridis]|uniref:uncharacterized protein n=1 Tax=Histomonas meleagridis TaxID=135588 RepID=UPI00355A20FB|nr:hypothetical protein GPJ56_006391 [Histomonas meleagridis]KAH0796793.1 hypothetical protein GO595_010686 [Histomonas meleagridis]